MKKKMYESALKLTQKATCQPIPSAQNNQIYVNMCTCSYIQGRTQTPSHSHRVFASSMRIMYKHSYWQIRSVSWGDDRVMNAECMDDACYPVWEWDLLYGGKKGVPLMQERQTERQEHVNIIRDGMVKVCLICRTLLTTTKKLSNLVV